MLNTAIRVAWVAIIFLAAINGQTCPNNCINCKFENGKVIKATCTNVLHSDIPDEIRDLELVNGRPFQIPFLSPYYFSNKKDLIILKILNYHIKDIKGPAFQGCPNLELLDFTDNELLTVTAINLQGLTNLTYLSFSGNAFTQLNSSPFQDLAALEELHLAHNKIAQLNEDDFKGLVNLKKICLEFNKISSIDKAFIGLKNLEDINLEGNQLTKLEAGMFDNLKNLRTLNLKDNKIQQIDPVSLEGTSPTFINLMQNDLTEVPTEFLQHISNSSLQVTMAANNISDIAEGELNSIFLHTLTLVGNNMNYIHPDALCNSFIENLDLQQNLLTHFPPGLQKYLNQSNSVLLGNNPWSCDCDIQWVKSLLRNNNPEPVCSKPLSYHGQPLTKILNDLKVSCKDNPVLPVPTRNYPVPPRQKLITPHLQQGTTKCSTTTNPKGSKGQKSSQKGEDSQVGIIVGVLVGLLFLLLLIFIIVMIIKSKKKKANVEPELNMECQKPDTNFRTKLHYLPQSNEYIKNNSVSI